MTSNTRRRTVAPLAAFLLLCGASAPAAWAYRYKTCNDNPQTWSTDGRTYRRLRVSFPDGSDSASSLSRSGQSWGPYAPGWPFQINIAATDNTWWGEGNGYNDIAFTDDYGWSTDQLAVCITYYKRCFFWADEGGIRETDILFRPNLGWNYTWNPTTADINGPNPSFALVAMHELGHSLGLKHEDRWMATMNSYYPHSGPLGSRIPDAHADDLNGARFLYGKHNDQRDVAASNFLRTGSGSAGPIVPPKTALRGQTITLPITISNRGTQSEPSVLVTAKLGAFYPFGVNVADLGSTVLDINQGEWTIMMSMTIPTWVAPGYYILRACVDASGSIYESDEANNCATYSAFTYIK